VFRVAVLDDYQRVAAHAADWSRLAGRADIACFHDNVQGDDLVARLTGFDGVVLMRERTRMPREVLIRLPQLRLITTSGSANAALDVAAARELGMVVCGTVGWSGVPPTVEHTWALIFAITRGIAREDAAIRNGGWMVGLGPTLQGKTLGIAGLGNLGRLMPAVAHALGMHVVAWSRNLDDASASAAGVTRLGHDEFFATADVVTVHIKQSDRSKGYIGETQLRRMKPSAYLVNTSRGSIVDTGALVRALDERWIAGAALDVFDEEPLPLDHPLRHRPNTVLTPHMGYASTDSYRDYYTQIVEDIDAFLRGEPVRVWEL
jgi:phosphoglycerate dehydrogenase-like enzyme